MQLSAIIRKDGKFYVAWCPDLDVASQGKTIEDSLANLKEAVELYLEDEDAPRPTGAPLFTTLEVHDGKAANPVGA